jgi:hypothetical protein
VAETELMFEHLRQQLLEERERIVARLAADVMVRLRDVFGLEAAPGRAEGVGQSLTPAASFAPILDGPAPEQRACAKCGAPFARQRYAGREKIYCSALCRGRANAARQRRKANGPGHVAAVEEAPQGGPFAAS